jgi:MoaA/NifB/PqqE/SkfB family radical SAM enzyme
MDKIAEKKINLPLPGNHEHQLKNGNYLTAPVFVWWDITRKCNFNCTYCYAHTDAAADGYVFNPDNYELATKEVLTLIKELAELGIFAIYFTGGEPFIRPDFLDILDFAQRNRLAIMLNTNGWFINEPIAKYLKQLGVRKVRVSLDGASTDTHDQFRNTKGAFNHAISAIRSLLAAGIPHVSIVTAVTAHNINEVDEIIDLAACLGVNDIQCVPLFQSEGCLADHEKLGLTAEELLILQQTIKQNHDLYNGKMAVYSVDGVYGLPFTHCVHNGLFKPDYLGNRAGRLACNINANGDIIPCFLVREAAAGNVRINSFKEIWQRSPAFTKWRRKRLDYPECIRILNEFCP